MRKSLLPELKTKENKGVAAVEAGNGDGAVKHPSSKAAELATLVG